MKFDAKNVYFKVENEVLNIALADSMDADPTNYLILQRCVDDTEPYYYAERII